MRWVLLAVLTGATGLTAQSDDGLIVPGERVGPVTLNSTEASLLRLLGKKAQKRTIDLGQGFSEPGLSIYSDDPTRWLQVLFAEGQPHRTNTAIIRCKPGFPCHWHTASGIGMGTRLKELERSNGKPFVIYGWGFDGAGVVHSYEGGKLETEFGGGRLFLRLYPCSEKDWGLLTSMEDAMVTGDKELRTDLPILQKLNPCVTAISVSLGSSR